MIEVYKKKYQTCLEMLEELRKERPGLRDEKLSYNGILDPMAEGIVPVLVGEEENKNRDRFTGSVKEYEVGVLVGVSTDSADLLGVVREWIVPEEIDVNNIVQAFVSYPQEFEQTVPMHSNRKVRGKRLWWWVLQGKVIPEDERPKNKVRIKEFEYLGESKVSNEVLVSEIENMNKNIGERFRRELVYNSWKQYFFNIEYRNYSLLKFRIVVTSGFYVRTYVENVSNIVNIPIVVYTLNRSRVYNFQ